jgi:long-subunit fatty acid transport protein
MPMSYGIGLSYRFSDTLTVSADVHRTHWDQFTHTSSEGDETSPISGLPKDDSDIDATHQFRLGAEYLVIKPKYVVPVRWGFFYDPAPAEGGNDDFFGLTAGSGIGFHRFSWDFAYQYRFGRNTGSSILKGLEFAEDQQDHTLFTSVIFYF